MRKFIGWMALGVVAAVAMAQGNGMGVVNAFVKTVNDAQSLNVTYTTQLVGSAATEYKLEFAKPNKARIESPKSVVVADGTTITTYDKSAKTYYKRPQNAAELKSLFADEDVALWSGFFFADAAKSVVSAKAMPNKTLAGQQYKVVEVAYDKTGKTATTLYVDGSNLVRRAQRTLSDQGVSETTIVITSEVALNGTGGDFAFKAPEGSKEVSLADMMSAKWYYDLEEAKKVAKQTNRKIFVDFMATWCGPCKLLDRDVLQTEHFKKTYSKSFVFVKIDVDAQPQVAQAYGITAMPTQMILDADGGVVGKTVGYGSPDGFYKFINAYL